MSNLKPYETIEDALAGMRAFEVRFRATRDRRAVFCTTYRLLTESIRDRVRDDFFADSDWVARYGLAFANYYRRAVLDFDAGRLEKLPTSWRISFETSQAGRALVSQDLLLGMNAHINHDLASALFDVGIGPDRASRLADHTRVNEILSEAADPIQQRISALYSPVLGIVDAAMGALDERVTQFSIERARQAAWDGAVALTDATSDAAREAVRRRIDGGAGVLARLIMAPSDRLPWLHAALRFVENRSSWLTLLG